MSGPMNESGQFENQPRGVARFWVSRLLSQTAQSALLYGLLIVIVNQTSSGIWPALFVVASIVPSLLFGLPGGVVADWLPQRALLVLLNAMRVAIILFMLLWSEIQLSGIFILTFAIWIVHQFYAPAESALLPKLVPPDRLPRATSLYNLALSAAQFLGLVMLAPIMLKYSSIEVLLAICAALYLVAAVVLLFVRLSRGSVPPPHESLRTETSGSLATGWRMMARDRRSFGALVDSVMVGIGLSALIVIVPQFLESVLHTDAGNTVFVFAPAAIGVVIGLQIAPLLGRIAGFGRLAFGGLALFACAIFMIGSINQISDILDSQGLLVTWLEERFALRPEIAATMLLSIPAGIAVGLVNVAIRTELVLRTPAESHARVFSTQMTIANLGALVPTLLAGALIDLVGVQVVATIIALGLLTGALLGRRIGRSQRVETIDLSAVT